MTGVYGLCQIQMRLVRNMLASKSMSHDEGMRLLKTVYTNAKRTHDANQV